VFDAITPLRCGVPFAQVIEGRWRTCAPRDRLRAEHCRGVRGRTTIRAEVSGLRLRDAEADRRDTAPRVLRMRRVRARIRPGEGRDSQSVLTSCQVFDVVTAKTRPHPTHSKKVRSLAAMIFLVIREWQ
jgi:hypothetical protein